METTQNTDGSKIGAVIIIVVVLVLGFILAKYYMEESQAVTGAAEEVTMMGSMVCLPHRDTSGPQTMECAFGLQADDGKHYGLHDTNLSYQNIASIPTGERIEVHGLLVRGENTKYATVGTINVDRVLVLNDRSI